MKSKVALLAALAVFSLPALADPPVIDRIPSEGPDSEGYYWVACKALSVSSHIFGSSDFKASTFTSSFAKSSVTPNSKGTNLPDGSCSWVDRTISPTEPTYLSGSARVDAIYFKMGPNSGQARDIVFGSDLPALTQGVVLIRGKTAGPRLQVKLETLRWVR